MKKLVEVLDRVKPAVLRLGGGGQHGLDLFGDVALACVEKAQEYDWTDEEIEGRVIQIAKNIRATRFRRESCRKTLPLNEKCAHFLATECSPNAVSRDDEAACRDAVSALPEKHQAVIIEHFMRGKRLEAIAKEMAVPSATVRTRLRRGLERLANSPAIKALSPV